MKSEKQSRRDFLVAGTAGCLLAGLPNLSKGAGPATVAPASATQSPSKSTVSVAPSEMRICLNFSALLRYNLTLEEELDLAAKVGFRSVEIWMTRLSDYLKRGKKLSDLKKWLSDKGIQVENAIGFTRCFLDDAAERAKGVTQLEEEMNLLAQLGCPCIATPVIGLTLNDDWSTIEKLGKRYRDLLLLGDRTGVRPLFELWGHLQPLCRLSRSVAVAMEAKHPNAALLLDAYHLYRGGNGYENLTLLSSHALPVFHANDFPGTPSYDKLKDADRVFPGDGVCPWPRLLSLLRQIHFSGALSLEIFNPIYQKQMTPLQLVQKSFDKMQKLVQ